MIASTLLRLRVDVKQRQMRQLPSHRNGTTAMDDRPKQSWIVSYPDNCVRYIEAFRRHFWDHAGVCRLLDEFFRADGNVHQVCELGSGAGTNMLNLAAYGYQCSG